MYHATSPFISEEHLIECINAVKSGEYDSAFAAKKLQNFMWYENKPLNFSLSPKALKMPTAKKFPPTRLIAPRNLRALS